MTFKQEVYLLHCLLIQSPGQSDGIPWARSISQELPTLHHPAMGKFSSASSGIFWRSQSY